MPQIPRLIRLRRPAILSVVDEPFVPDLDAAARDQVQWRWQSLCRANPAYFDGRVYHVFGVHRNGHGGAVIHVASCPYRYHAVQDDRFDVGVRSLGVKGIVQREGRSLLGRRSRSVASYAGQWEFAPAGVVDPGETPEQTAARELTEETGLRSSGPPIPIAVMYDTVLRCWEVVLRLPATGSTEVQPDEYDELAWYAPGSWPAPLTPMARHMLHAGLLAGPLQ